MQTTADLAVILQALARDNPPANFAQAPAAMPALALPEPTNTGDLDMSVILGGANRANTADNGRDANRHPGRPLMRPGSRSRSPARRDPHYGTQNPYIDQRRDDTRGRTNGRNRSASPSGRGPAQGAQGYKRERSPLLQVDNNTEVIDIENSHVGLVIGRNGENLKRVEGETGARVQFVADKGAPNRQCKISGTARQRAEAKAQIFQTISANPKGPPAPRAQPSGFAASSGFASNSGFSSSDQSPPMRPGEKSSQMNVPDRTVGLIIGRGGETIRDIQGRSGCHVNIVHENKSVNGLRPVNLIGTDDATQKAMALINEIVKSDSRGTGAPALPEYGQQSNYNQYNAGGVYNTNGDSKINDNVTIPSEAVGMVIGKGGEAIKEIQNISGCKVNVDPAAEGVADINRMIRLIGTRQAIESAKKLIWEKVETVRAKQGGLRADSTTQYADQYAQYQPQQYGAPAVQAPLAPTQALPAPTGEPNDPYAAYGGYATFVALWNAHQAGQANLAAQGPAPGA